LKAAVMSDILQRLKQFDHEELIQTLEKECEIFSKGKEEDTANRSLAK